MTDKFPTKSNFQGDLFKEFFSLISFFQLFMHLGALQKIKARNTHVANSLH